MKIPRRWPGESRFHGWLYILPGLLIYLVFVFYPILETFRTSFFEWDGFSSNRVFVSFQNYIALVTDAQFLKALLNNLTFIIFYSIIPIVIGLFLASLLGRKPLPGLTFFRTGLFLPQILSMVVVGVTWRWIFNPTFGLLNVGLRALGLDALTRAWLGDFQVALPAVGAVGTWVQYGFCMVLFLAGMQRIPEDQYEAAELDGANEFRQLLHITLPSLRAELGVALITTVIAALRVFDLVYVTTRGGPGDSTLVTGFLVYRSAFQQNQLGYASAVATVMTLLIFVISLVILRFQARGEEGS
ncbi:MAG TPA: sugar ABC transporter permease [Anaerolineaceae bacterium]|nr:sugar ABC transporter permease [Anaerolineaceae bacterium]